ncbi:DUF6817 domain-containing protein [Nocardia sp. NPDC004340]
MAVEREQVELFLRDLGAEQIPHPGGTLMTHLARVADLLARWGADADVQYAGLCHAMYGTDGFDRSLLEVSERAKLAALIGSRAEELVYLYGSCDRSAVYPRLGATPTVFTDRFTGREHDVDDDALQAFLEITAANELDVMVHNTELAAMHGAALYQLFARTADHLSPAALQAWRNRFGPR